MNHAEPTIPLAFLFFAFAAATGAQTSAPDDAQFAPMTLDQALALARSLTRSIPPTPFTVRAALHNYLAFTTTLNRSKGRQGHYVLVVPNSAIITEAGVDYVYAVIDGVLKKKSVETGIETESVTEITSGLDEGTKVVMGGQTFLNDGQRVRSVHSSSE